MVNVSAPGDKFGKEYSKDVSVVSIRFGVLHLISAYVLNISQDDMECA
jgi:hypothetical protein